MGQMNVSVTDRLADFVRKKVRTGQYNSASEVVRDGVCALLERDAAVEQWLRDEVIAGHQEYLADPSQGVPAEEILDRIKAHRTAR